MRLEGIIIGTQWVLAPAKINLSLDVLGKRADGYHEVEMVMQTINLCDQLRIDSDYSGKIRLKCKHPFVPEGPENLVYKAARLLQDYSPQRGAVIEVTKQIPVAAGLGGGSSDAAAALKALNRLWELNLAQDELAGLALKLGADVPFFLQGGTALARGLGELLSPLPKPPGLWVVLYKPNLGVSTAEVYQGFRSQLIRQRPDTTGLVAALASGNVQALAAAMENVLESVTFARYPLLKRLKQKAFELGATAAMMSGSGPTLFALVSDYRRAMAIYNGLKYRVEFVYVTTFREGTV